MLLNTATDRAHIRF